MIYINYIGAPLPAYGEDTFQTSSVGQKKVRVPIYEGNTHNINTDYLVDHFLMDLTKIKKHQKVDVTVKMHVDLEGKITTTCIEKLNTNNSKEISNLKKNMVLSVTQLNKRNNETKKRVNKKIKKQHELLGKRIKAIKNVQTTPITYQTLYNERQRDSIATVMKWYKNNKNCNDMNEMHKYSTIFNKALHIGPEQEESMINDNYERHTDENDSDTSSDSDDNDTTDNKPIKKEKSSPRKNKKRKRSNIDDEDATENDKIKNNSHEPPKKKGKYDN